MICNNRCNNWHWNHNCGCNDGCGNSYGCNNGCGCNHGCHHNCWNNHNWWNQWECARPWNRWGGNYLPCRPGPVGPVGPAGPVGPIGPIGPVGPAAPTVYGGLINTTPQTLTLTAAVPTTAPLAVQLPADGVNYTPANSITIEEAGDYAITYFLANGEITGITDTDVTLTIRSNGIPLTNTAVTATAQATEDLYVNGNTIQTLPAGAVIDMTVTAADTIGLSLGNNTTLALIVHKLG